MQRTCGIIGLCLQVERCSFYFISGIVYKFTFIGVISRQMKNVVNYGAEDADVCNLTVNFFTVV